MAAGLNAMHPARLLRKRASARLVERIVTAVAYEATAQTAPDTNPIFYATGTNAWSSRFARLQQAEPFRASFEIFSNKVTFAKMRPRCDSSGALQKIKHCEVQRAVPQPRLLKANKKGPPTEAG